MIFTISICYKMYMDINSYLLMDLTHQSTNSPDNNYEMSQVNKNTDRQNTEKSKGLKSNIFRTHTALLSKPKIVLSLFDSDTFTWSNFTSF